MIKDCLIKAIKCVNPVEDLSFYKKFEREIFSYKEEDVLLYYDGPILFKSTFSGLNYLVSYDIKEEIDGFRIDLINCYCLPEPKLEEWVKDWDNDVWSSHILEKSCIVSKSYSIFEITQKAFNTFVTIPIVFQHNPQNFKEFLEIIYT